MKYFSKIKGQCLITALLVLILLIMPFQDYTEQTFLSDTLEYPDDLAGTFHADGGVLDIPAGLGTFTLNTDSHYLKHGTYEVTFNVTSDTEGSSVDVFNPYYVNEDNTCGKVLASAPISTNGENIHVTFTVEDYVEAVQFRVNSVAPLTFDSIYLLSQRGLYKDPYIYAGLLLLASVLFLVYRRKHKVRPEPLLLLLFAALWTTLPMCFPWLPSGHDMYFHYGRLFNLSEGLGETLLPIRYHARMFRGFGYGAPMLYSEFFLYPFALLCRMGLSPIGCWHLMILTVNLATAAVSYYAFSHLCRSRRIGLIASFLYTMSMYRLINLYTRAALGEVLATIFLPLLVIGMYHLFLGNMKKWWIAVLAFTGMFQSHVISTEIALGFCVLFALWNIRKLKEKGRLPRILLAGASTVLLNLWFILPFLDHMRYAMFVLGDERNLYAYSVYPAQFFDMSLNNPAMDSLGRTSFANSMPFSVGLILLAGSLLFLLLCFRKEQPDRFHMNLGKWCLSLGILSLYASSVYFPWEAIQRVAILNLFAEKIQFASRFLPFASLFLGITSSLAIYYFFRSREQKQLLFLICGIFLVYTSGKYMSDYSNSAENFVDWDTQMEHSQDTDTLYLISDNHAYVSVRRMLVQDTNFQSSGDVELSGCYRDGTDAGFTYHKTEGSSDSYVDVPFNFYPYLHAYDENGNQLTTSHGELLRLRVALPASSDGAVTIRMEMPSFYRVGDLISLLTLLSLMGGFVFVRNVHGKNVKKKEENGH